MALRFSGPPIVLASFITALSVVPLAVAQNDNPFGEDDSDDAAIVLTEPNTTRVGESTTDLLIRSVTQSNPTTPLQLSQAIVVMMDLDQWDRANDYLNQFAAIELDGPGAYKLNDKIGSDFFYQLARVDELQPAGREQATRVFGLATQWANSRERIDGLLDQLASENTILRSESFERLRRIGNPAVARILESFTDENRKDEYPGLRGALYRFDKTAVPVLIGAAHAEAPEVQLEAIRALAEQSSNEALDEMMWAWLDPKSPPKSKAVAASRMTKAGVALDPGKMEARLATRVRRFLAGRRTSTDDISGDLKVWNWNGDTGQLESARIDPRIGTRQRGLRLARTLYNINPNSVENQKLLMLSELESRKRASGPSRRIDAQAFVDAYPQANADRLNQLLLDAIQMDLIPAAIACCEVLKTSANAAHLNGRPCPLVEAILSGERQLQFAAFDAITEIDPKTPFHGCSYVADFATYIASSRFQRAVLVGHNREEVARSTAATLQSLKWGGDPAINSREIFERINANPDLEILLIGDAITRPAARELVQQLRNNWKAKRIPIGIIADTEERLIRSSRLTHGADQLLTFPTPTDTQALARQIGELGKLHKTWGAVSSDDRFAHASRAVQWLSRISVDSQYGFYNVAKFEDRMLEWLYHPEFTEPAAKILAANPSATAQRALVSFISQNELPIEARQAVANSFEKAIESSGTLLTTGDIKLQYDRYNASESQPVETQQILGRVLDIIEKAAQ